MKTLDEFEVGELYSTEFAVYYGNPNVRAHLVIKCIEKKLVRGFIKIDCSIVMSDSSHFPVNSTFDIECSYGHNPIPRNWSQEEINNITKIS